MDDATLQTIGLALGLVLSLMIYSYLLGDNPLYRLAVHLMVGVGLGYAVVVVFYTVLIPQLINPLQLSLSGGAADASQVPVVLLAILLLFKLSRHTAPLGNLAMAFVMGVGSAVAVGGAILGTLLPQIGATALPLFPNDAVPLVVEQNDPLNILNVLAALVLITGTITSLLYFYFDARPLSEDEVERPKLIRMSASIGQVFLMIAFGSLFAGSIIASLSILTQRISFYSEEIFQLLGWG